MAMHADMIAALRARAKRCHLVKVVLPDHTVLWTDGGVVKWGSDVYRAKDATYGSLKEIGDIEDGIEVDGEPVTISVIPPSLISLEALADADAQGGRVEIYLVALVNGAIAGEPYLLYIGELDQPSMRPGRERVLDYDVIPGEARALRVSEEQRQTDAFHRYRWPGEKGQQYATDGTKLTYWREDETRSVLGVTLGRGLENTNKAIQFTYEPNAPFAFPFGRVGIAGGEMRYRIGYGPTNRYQTTFNTIAASGPIGGLVSVAFDDTVTTFDGSDRATNGDHAGFMWFKFLPGDQPSSALTSPTGTEAHTSAAPGWTTDHKLSGSACYAWTGKENSKKSEFGGGLPKPLLVIDGLYGYDPTDVDSEIDDVSTWTVLDEGCRVALNWTIGRWEGDSGSSTYGVPYLCTAVGGIAAPLELIDVDAFADAAEIADGYGWKFAGTAYSDEDRIDALDDMLAVSGAKRSRKAGRISCVSLAAPKASSLTITNADTAGSPNIILAASRLDRINTGIPEFLSADHRWEIVPADPVSNAAWVTADGGRNTDSFEYRFCPDKDQASQLCYLEMARMRAGVSVSGDFQTWMMSVEPGDTVTWDEPEFLLENVKCRVWKRSYSPTTTLVKLELRQDLTDQDYTDAIAITGTVPTPSDPSTPTDDTVDPPTDESISVSGDEVTIDWTNGSARFFRTLILQSATSDIEDATQVASKGGGPGEAQTAVLKPGPGTWYFWIMSRSAPAEDYSDPVSLGSVVVAVDIDTDNLDDLNILRRTGGGVFTGDLTATEGASWGGNLTGRPTELTDGRITTALNASGVLQTAIPSGLADTSNLLRRAGGGLFSGDLAATAGADWSSNLTNRPTELTDGRVGTALDASGVLQTAIPSTLADASDLLRFSGGGAFTGALNANYITATSELSDDANLGGTASWTGVSGRPTDLSELDAAAATKLAGIESGAQVNPANLAALDATAASDLAAAKAGVDGLGALAAKNTVATADIDDNSVISIDPFEFSGTVTTSGATSDATAVTVMEFEVDSDGEPLLIRTELMAKFWHPSAGDFSFTLRFQRVGEAGVLRNDLVINGINGDQFHGFLAPTFLDVPSAGTHTYKVFAWASTNTGFTHRDFTDRFATVTHLKATTLA